MRCSSAAGSSHWPASGPVASAPAASSSARFPQLALERLCVLCRHPPLLRLGVIVRTYIRAWHAPQKAKADPPGSTSLHANTRTHSPLPSPNPSNESVLGTLCTRFARVHSPTLIFIFTFTCDWHSLATSVHSYLRANAQPALASSVTRISVTSQHAPATTARMQATDR